MECAMKPPDNKALAGAQNKGMAAGLAGKPTTACPYGDVRTNRGHVTWSRAFRRAWLQGWDVGHRRRTDGEPKPDVARGEADGPAV